MENTGQQSFISTFSKYWAEHNENFFALTMLILAAFLAINDLIAGRYGDDEIMMTNEKSNQFQWYQSKSIKEYVVKGQADLLDTLIKSEIIHSNNLPAFQEQQKKLLENVKRYQKEKQEIMLGSFTVGKANWVQDLDGKMGQIVGVKEYEKELKKFGKAGDLFDMASLFFQIALMFGALGIMMKKITTKKYAFIGCLFLGLMGIIYSVKGILTVL